mgnify:CR=1 FL=1
MAEILSYNPYRDMHGNVQFSAAFSGKNIQNFPIFNTSQTSVKEFDLYGFKVFTFTGKERDSETGYSYFGARYYDSDLMTGWLSVDPMADKYPSLSPYAYCGWNPVKLVDPDGRDIEIVKDDENKTVSIRGNFYYNKDEIGVQAGVFMDGLEAALNSWSEDIRTALKDESLGAAGYNVNFEFKYIECEDPEFSAKTDVEKLKKTIEDAGYKVL